MARVGTAGCVRATPSAGLLYSGGTATSGAWTAVPPGSPVVETVDPTVHAGGAGVLHRATCTFTFTGMQGSTAVTDSVTVDLEPAETRLLGSGTALLLDGDTAHDPKNFGNSLTVVVPAGSKLRLGGG